MQVAAEVEKSPVSFFTEDIETLVFSLKCTKKSMVRD